jgi:hypothetical protein
MRVPDWWTAALLTLASFRTWRLLAKDVVLDGVRDWVTGLSGWSGRGRPPATFRTPLSEFILCPWCLGFWITLVWWGAWQAWPHATLVVAGLGLLMAGVGLIAKLDKED